MVVFFLFRLGVLGTNSICYIRKFQRRLGSFFVHLPQIEFKTLW